MRLRSAPPPLSHFFPFGVRALVVARSPDPAPTECLLFVETFGRYLGEVRRLRHNSGVDDAVAVSVLHRPGHLLH
jgi:hypothetical protein